jgi:Tol biopolymer transport system component
VYLFALTGFARNDGFGDLYIYNSDLHKADLEVNPVDGVCCYRDPQFSPDGQYLAFAFQDIRAGAANPITLYYIDLSTLGTGVRYTPIPLPEDFFSNPREKPQPILRPHQP